MRGCEANGKGEKGVARECDEREREEVNGKGERELKRGDKRGLVLGGKGIGRVRGEWQEKR